MTATIYDYHTEGRRALVNLIAEAKPQLGVMYNNVDFDEPFFSPTVAEPGRTFIDMTQLDKGQKYTFAYRRLDMKIAMGTIKITLGDVVTTRNIVDEINRTRGYVLNERDTDYSDYELAPRGTSIYYRMKASAGSYVWYGETVVEVSSSAVLVGSRKLEDERPRLLEAGDPRMLEETVAAE